MTLFLITFAVFLIVVSIMAVGVLFGRAAIKGSCGGSGNGEACVCVKKCDARLRREATEKKNHIVA